MRFKEDEKYIKFINLIIAPAVAIFGFFFFAQCCQRQPDSPIEELAEAITEQQIQYYTGIRTRIDFSPHTGPEDMPVIEID